SPEKTAASPRCRRRSDVEAAELRLKTFGRRNHMSHAERRTAHRARPLSLLILAALLVSACSSREDTHAPDVRAPREQGQAQPAVPATEMAANTNTDAKSAAY